MFTAGKLSQSWWLQDCMCYQYFRSVIEKLPCFPLIILEILFTCIGGAIFWVPKFLFLLRINLQVLKLDCENLCLKSAFRVYFYLTQSPGWAVCGGFPFFQFIPLLQCFMSYVLPVCFLWSWRRAVDNFCVGKNGFWVGHYSSSCLR